MRTAVVLPAPLGPSKPSTVPGRATKSTPLSAVVSPKRFTRPSACMPAVMGSRPPAGSVQRLVVSRPSCRTRPTVSGERDQPSANRARRHSVTVGAFVGVAKLVVVYGSGVVGHVRLHLARRPLISFRRWTRREIERRPLHLEIRKRREQVSNHVDSRRPLVLAEDHIPRRLRYVGVQEHLVLGPRVVLPPVNRLQIHRRELPAPHRVLESAQKAVLLLSVADREPVLPQQDAVFHQQPLEDRALMEETHVLLLRTEAHHPFDAGAVVPASIEQNDLARGRQVLDIALEVPPRPLPFGRRGKRDDPGNAGVEVLRDPLDRAALSGRIAALEDHNQPSTLSTHPFLQLHELSLKAEELLLIGLPRHCHWPLAVDRDWWRRLLAALDVFPVLRFAGHVCGLSTPVFVRHRDRTTRCTRLKGRR